jgi:hypothetical protein
MNIHKRASKCNYPKLKLVIVSEFQVYKNIIKHIKVVLEWKYINCHHNVHGSIHPRKDLLLIAKNIVKAPINLYKDQVTTKQYDIQERVGKSLDNPEVNDLVGIRIQEKTKKY